jgi:hypothetical protein
MSRRASLPGAAELFRATSAASDPEVEHNYNPGVSKARSVEVYEDAEPGPLRHIAAAPSHVGAGANSGSAGNSGNGGNSGNSGNSASVGNVASAGNIARSGAVRNTRRIRAVSDRLPSGRELHEEKITVYCSPEELLDLERARLHLRAEHGLAVDRGRIVREAVAVVLADLESKGESSILVRRLREA